MRLADATRYGISRRSRAVMVSVRRRRSHDEKKGVVTLEDDDEKKSDLVVRRPMRATRSSRVIELAARAQRGNATHINYYYYGEHLAVRLRARDVTHEMLMTRGFHWVDEGGFWR